MGNHGLCSPVLYVAFTATTIKQRLVWDRRTGGGHPVMFVPSSTSTFRQWLDVRMAIVMCPDTCKAFLGSISLSMCLHPSASQGEALA